MSLADQLWCPTSVQVTVLQARGLKIKGKGGTNDAFAVMQVGKEKYQTSVAEKSVAPAWREEATFDLPQQPGGGGGGGAERSTLHVHVLHRALVGPDKLLGQAVMNLAQLSQDKTRSKSEWFKLLDKTGKADKDRGEVLVDIQFLRNHMTASMFDLSAAGKSKSRLGKFKDKVRGKKKDSEAAPSFPQVLTDSEDEDGNGDSQVVAEKDEKKKKKKITALFAPKSNLQRNMSQSMSVLPAKNSLSGSQSSGLNVDPSEGKKKFKFMIHKRSGSSGTRDSSSAPQQAAEQSSLCINGSHVYSEQPQHRGAGAGSSFSLASSGHGSMEDVPGSSPPSVDSLRTTRQYSPWTEEEEEEEESVREGEGETGVEREREVMVEGEMRRMGEEENARREVEGRILEEGERMHEEGKRRDEQQRWHKEETRRREEEMIRVEEERRKEEKIRLENEERKLEEEKARMEEEKRKQEEKRRAAEEERRLEEMARKEEERKREMEMIRIKEEEARREEEMRKEIEWRRVEEEERARKEEEKKREMERIRIEEEERARKEEERNREMERIRIEEEERARKEEERKREVERIRIEEEERARKEEDMRKELESRRVEEEKKRCEENARMEEKRRKLEEEEKRRIKEENFKKEMLDRQEEEMMKQKQEQRRQEEEEDKKEEKARGYEEEYVSVIKEMKKHEEETGVVASLNPFDENFQGDPSFPAGPGSSRAGVSHGSHWTQPAASPLRPRTSSSGDADHGGSQREKRPAPRPPGSTGITAGLPQALSPASRSDPRRTSTHTSSLTVTASHAQHGKGPAPARPEPSGAKTSPTSNIPKTQSSGVKEEPFTCGYNPFEDDEDDELTAEDEAPYGSKQGPKIKSSKKVHAPPLPDASDTSSTSVSLSPGGRDGGGDPAGDAAGDAGPVVTDPDNHGVHLRDACSISEAKPATLQLSGGKKGEAPTSQRRLLPVKPLNSLRQSVNQGEKDIRIIGILSDDPKNTKVDSELKGPFSQLTKAELISLVLKQQNQLSEKDTKICELEQYIDNLLVRVMEEQPSILMSMNSLKKSV